MAGTSPPASPLREFLAKREGQVALALLFLLSIPLLTKVFTSDFGTHIAIGRQIVGTRSIPDREFLNYPSLGIPNIFGEWGFQVLLFLVHRALGIYGVSFLIWAVVFSICLLIHRSTVLRGGNPLLAVAALFAFAGFLRIRIQPRPEIFTYLFTALTIFLLSEYYFGKRKWIIWIFPAAVLVWANMHPTYLMGFLLCGAFFVDALARAAWNREFRWERLKGWVVPPVAAGLGGLLLCGLNPHGYEALMAPVHMILKSGPGVGAANPITASISELTPVKGTGMYVYYKAAAVFAVCSLLLGVAGRRVYLLDLFLFAIAFKGSWDSARAVSMMGLFLAPGATLHLTGFLGRLGLWLARRPAPRPAPAAAKKGKRPKGRAERPQAPASAPLPARPLLSRLRIAATAAIVVALLAFGGTTLAFSFSQLQFGVGMTEHKFSFAAAEFLRRNPIPGNMFNFFDIGGFLDWQLYPKALTFIDGRAYNPPVFMEHQAVTGAMPGWEEIFRKYGINYVVIKTVDSSGMVLPIVPALSNSPDWALVFADGLFVVFVRNTPENQPLIRAYGLPKNAIPRQVIWESYHYMYLGVSPVLAYQIISNMHQILGEREAAIQALKKGLSYSDEPFLRASLRRLEEGIDSPRALPPGHPPPR